jgi:hypothetical protein
VPTDTTVTVTLEADAEPAIRSLAVAAIHAHTLGCRVCRHYLERRGDTLLTAVVVQALAYELVPALRLLRYVRSVHDRHVAGGSLSTRHHTALQRTGPSSSRIRVQRSCNGCQKTLGDANAAELDAAVAGQMLPDVRLECGCWTNENAA